MQKIIKNIALFFLIASWFSSAYADTTEILNKTLPISSFMIDNKPIALHGSSDSYEISIPVSDRITPLSLDLNLQLYNS